MMNENNLGEAWNLVEKENPTTNNNTMIHVEVLSPTHIGGISDKHWKKGADFFYEDNLLYEIDRKKLFDQLVKKDRLDDYLTMLSTQSENLKNNIFEEFRLEEQDILKPIACTQLTEDAEIRMFLSNGLGQPILPGSSFKGAIRSTIFHYLYNNVPTLKTKVDKLKIKRRKYSEIEQAVFGKIDNNLMRFIRISDASFKREHFIFLSTKVMSRTRDTNLLPVWKFTEKDAGSSSLKEDQFATSYQFLNKGAISTFKLSFLNGNALVSKLERSRKTPSYLGKLLSDNPVKELFKWINKSTRDHVEKEIKYFRFNANPNQQSHSYFLKLADWLEYEILPQIPKDSNTVCVLRVGQGVGFHSITGGWQTLKNHTDILHNRINDKQYKTRKIVLDKDFNSGEYKMYTTGFIKLYTPKEWNKKSPKNYYNTQIDSIPEGLEKVAFKIAELKRKEAAEKAPKYYKGKLKNGQILDAQYIGNEKGNVHRKIFKLLIGEVGKEQEMVLTYRSDLNLNVFYQVSIKLDKKKKTILAISFKGKK